MSPLKRFVIGGTVGAMVLCMAGLPLIFMTLPNPQPLPAKSPGELGRGVYVQDAAGSFKLFPRAQLPSEWPKDAFPTDGSVRVFVLSRQYDNLVAYGVFTFPDGKPLSVSKRMVPGKMLRLAPAAPLRAGRYVVQVSRDDAYGGSDYFCLSVR